MTIGPIPLSRIEEYLRRYSLPLWWVAPIARADQTYMKLLADEMSKNSAA